MKFMENSQFGMWLSRLLDARGERKTNETTKDTKAHEGSPSGFPRGPSCP
jgi:hypothetical protein